MIFHESLTHAPPCNALGHRSTHGIWLVRSLDLGPPALQLPGLSPTSDAAANTRSLVVGAVPWEQTLLWNVSLLRPCHAGGFSQAKALWRFVGRLPLGASRPLRGPGPPGHVPGPP